MVQCLELIGEGLVLLTEAELSQISVAMIVQLQDLNARAMTRLGNHLSGINCSYNLI
jgi:hypothetical protein